MNEAVNYVKLYVKSVDIRVAKMQASVSSSAWWDLIVNIKTSHQRLVFISTFVLVKY